MSVDERFGAPGVEFHSDDRVQHVDVRPGHTTPARKPAPPTIPSAAPRWPVSTPPVQSTAGQLGDAEDAPVVLGARTWAWIAERLRAGVTARITAQPWVCKPQPSLRLLLEHAQIGDWTTSPRRRAMRVGWLYLPAALPRLAANTALRVLRPGSPGVLADQPPIADVLGGDAGTARRVGLWVVYLPLRLASVVADFAYRTWVALLLAWLAVNAIGHPEVVTVAYWVRRISASVAATYAELSGPVTGTVLTWVGYGLATTGAVLVGLLGWWLLSGNDKSNPA